MPTFADMIKLYDSAPVPPVAETPPVREVWDILCDRWPPLSLPKPPEPLALDWVWAWVLLEPMPSWPEGSLVAKYLGGETWERIERCLDRGEGLSAERVAWLRTHEKEIRPLLETARAEHFAHYPIRR